MPAKLHDDLRITLDVFFQDPMVAASDPQLAFDTDFRVLREPGFGNGPTSARFAVVDYNGDSETLTPPARWDADRDAFLSPAGEPLDRDHTSLPQFHQVNAWALAQRALELYEGGFGLGRRIPWGFEGSRLLIVPHAGYGENAYYDRESKSLQFYYFERDGERIDTCLSADIVHHEFGHAVLDGVRPHLHESLHPQTAAFHEFVGDLTAIIMIFRNNAFRRRIAARTGGNLAADEAIAGLAEQFGKHVSDKPYLRTARSRLTMKEVAGELRPHRLSEVLTSAMFDIVLALSESYARERQRSGPEGFWNTIDRMQRMAIQPLDLLPPVDVTFRDYALAVLRAEEIANPTDPWDYRGMMLKAFRARGILSAADAAALKRPHYLFERLDLDVEHDAGYIGESPANAYKFLDDNRRKLLIPWNADVSVADLSVARKLTREGRQLPRQVVLQYLWREEVALEGPRFGRYSGQVASLPCGGTLALDQNGNVLMWARKPGILFQGKGALAQAEAEEGQRRRAGFLASLERQVRTGRIGDLLGGDRSFLPGRTPPLTTHVVGDALRFELAPHFGVHDDEHDALGGRQWQISS